MRSAMRIGVLLIVLLLVATWISMLPRTPREVVDRDHTCVNKLSLLGLALHNYHDDYGSFPPAFVVAEDGMTRHSWRVMALLYFDEQPLYEQYRFDEPWDGENNRTLHDQLFGRHWTHICPTIERDDLGASVARLTSYLAVVGPHTAWRGAKPVSLNEITDGIDQTILLVEVENSDINWFEPRDLSWDEMSFRLNDPDSLSPSSRHIHNGGWFGDDRPFVNVLMVDGSVKKLPADTPPETLKALLTIDGGEDVGDPFLD